MFGPATKGFIVGSSLPAFAITAGYVGRAYHDSGDAGIAHPEALPFFIPGLYGIANAINMSVQKSRPMSARQRRLTSAVTGAALGLTLSLIGHEGMDLPTKIFGLTEKQAPRVHVVAPLLYAAIFGTVVHYLNENTR